MFFGVAVGALVVLAPAVAVSASGSSTATVTAYSVAGTPEAAPVELASHVRYDHGLLWVYRGPFSLPVSVSFSPGLKVTGQLLQNYVLHARDHTRCYHRAVFKPAVSREYRFGDSGGVASLGRKNFDFLVVRVAGEGTVTCRVGGERRTFSVNEPERPFDVKFPDLKVKYNIPYTLTATGNIRLAKVSSGPCTKGNFTKEDVWQYSQKGAVLDGTMELGYQLTGQRFTVGFTLPFCPGSASFWMAHEQIPPEVSPKKAEPQQSRPARWPLIPALALSLLFLVARPFRTVNVSVELDMLHGGLAVYRDRRGPGRVSVAVYWEGQLLTQLSLEREGRVNLPRPAPGRVGVRTPGYRNISQRQSVVIPGNGPPARAGTGRR